MSASTLRKIFYPSDFRGGDEAAFEHALKIALATGGLLDLLHVDGPEDEFDWSLFPSARVVLERWGALPPGSMPEDVASTGVQVRKEHRRAEGITAAIQGHIAAEKPDLVVLATHQRTGVGRWLHRALAEPVARNAHAPTLFVPRRVQGFVRSESGRVQLQTVLIPVDQRPHPQAAVDTAAQLLRTLGCRDTHFILLHVGPTETVPRVEVPVEAGWTSEVETWEGPVVDHILASAEANEADLIVMAKRGQVGVLDALRGSTTERVVRETHCPVMVVPVMG